MNRFMRSHDRERVPLTEPGTHVSINPLFLAARSRTIAEQFYGEGGSYDTV